MAKKEITKEDELAASVLRELWSRLQAKRKSKNMRKLSQEKAAESLDMSQGAFSHYLNCLTPLGVQATLKFAKFFGVAPSDIRPDVAYLTQTEQPSSQSATPPLAQESTTAYGYASENDLLLAVMKVTKEVLKERGIKLPDDKESELIALLFDDAKRQGKAQDPEWIARLARFAG